MARVCICNASSMSFHGVVAKFLLMSLPIHEAFSSHDDRLGQLHFDVNGRLWASMSYQLHRSCFERRLVIVTFVVSKLEPRSV